MNFYELGYLEAQSNLGNYVKYIFIFGSLILLICVFSLYLKHRFQTKYRDLSLITLLFLLFLLGVQYTEYDQNKNNDSRHSQMVYFVKQVAKEKEVAPNQVLVNSTQLNDGILVKIKTDYYKVSINPDQRSYTLERAYLMDQTINIME